jgi:hypothetical protein
MKLPSEHPLISQVQTCIKKHSGTSMKLLTVARITFLLSIFTSIMSTRNMLQNYPEYYVTKDIRQ